jgi:hypothetical protein
MQTYRMVARVRQGHSMAETAMVMMIERALFVMRRVAGIPVIMMMFRLHVHGGNVIAGILRDDTRLKPGANA